MTKQEALKRAFRIAGGYAVVANALKIKRQSTRKWRICPPTRVLALEELTGGKVTRFELRPDIYPPE